MAQIRLADLIALIKASPRYYQDFVGDTPAEQSLRIVLGDKTGLRSETFPTDVGSEVILDLDDSGKVWGIEIF